MIHLFIDTNRYLVLYGFKKEELNQIEKLVHLIENKKVTLWLPEQVKVEFYRNREKIPLQKCETIKISLSEYKTPKLPEISEFETELQELSKKFEEIKKIDAEINTKVDYIVTSMKEKLKKNLLLADRIVEKLFSAAKFIRYDDETIKKAKTRYDLGIPPGKGGSYGDAVIWEALLKEFPSGEELHFVGVDKDFRSNIDDTEFSPFLQKEWLEIKKSNIKPYRNLGEFTKIKIPEIEKSDKITQEEENIDRNFLVTATALNEAFNEISISTQAWEEMMESMSAYRNAITHAVTTVSIPIDIINQQAALVEQFNDVINTALKNTTLSSPIVVAALEAYKPYRREIVQEAISEAIKDTENKESKDKEDKK